MSDRQLQEPTRLVLTALADAPRHGYAIVQEVLAISDGQVRLRTGTLYTALDRLLQQGLIQIHAEEVVDGRLRRSYALTGTGRDTLTAETRRLSLTVREAERRLALSTRPGRQARRQPGHGFGPGTVTA
ncbi:helix-turn-helix transcriptional regulator [Streptacidiphilus sp. 4-A2]|nr:helix-turn-helix transcriptional regulator [Streptacidiphilus sp. 4-A2]